MVSFHIGSLKVGFDFSFFAVMAIFFALDDSGYGIFCIAACLCHEAGHLALLLITGDIPPELIFSGSGICIKQEGEVSIPVLAAGCTVNFILFIIFYFFLEQDSVYKLMFAGSNLCIGAMNLLPIGELDGKKLLERFFTAFLPFKAAQRALYISELAGFALAAVAVAILLLSGTINITSVFQLAHTYGYLLPLLQSENHTYKNDSLRK